MMHYTALIKKRLPNVSDNLLLSVISFRSNLKGSCFAILLLLLGIALCSRLFTNLQRRLFEVFTAE